MSTKNPPDSNSKHSNEENIEQLHRRIDQLTQMVQQLTSRNANDPTMQDIASKNFLNLQIRTRRKPNTHLSSLKIMKIYQHSTKSLLKQT